jgi:hypothetical protein
MNGTTVGFGVALLVAFVLIAGWFMRRAKEVGRADSFDLDRGFGGDRPRHFGTTDPGAWRPSDGRW